MKPYFFRKKFFLLFILHFGINEQISPLNSLQTIEGKFHPFAFIWRIFQKFQNSKSIFQKAFLYKFSIKISKKSFSSQILCLLISLGMFYLKKLNKIKICSFLAFDQRQTWFFKILPFVLSWKLKKIFFI
jgi:hypothetical protein